MCGSQSMPLGGGYKRSTCPGGAEAQLAHIPPVMAMQRAGDACVSPRPLHTGSQAVVGIAALVVGLFLPSMCTCLVSAISRQGTAALGPARAGEPGHAWGMQRSEGEWLAGFGALISVLCSVRQDRLRHPAPLGAAPAEGRWHVWPWTGTCRWGSCVPAPQGRVQLSPASRAAELGTRPCRTMCSPHQDGRVAGSCCR